MKKQFFRVKQLADQTFSKGEKTEVPEDLSNAERHVDQMKLTCQNLNKKIQACLQGQGATDGIGREKRLKKIPESQLGQSSMENILVDQDSLLWIILKTFGCSQKEVGECILNYEVEVEKEVISKMNDFLEMDIPNVMKNKKHLARLTLDMDSTRARHMAALKSNNHTEKAEVIQDELDDAVQKVEQCRDSLAADMFALMARESEVCTWITRFVQAQADHHRKALKLLESVLPQMQDEIDRYHLKPVFGCELETHLSSSERKIAYPIETCVCYLNEYGLKEEGLFRVAGSTSKVRRLKAALDAGVVVGKLDSENYSYDVHTVAGTLKSYLRELPNPLLNNNFYDEWMQVAKLNDVEVRRDAILKVLNRLPKSYFNNLRYFVKFLNKLTTYHESNKMSSQNLAIVIALNLIWSPEEPTDNMLGMNRLTGAHTLLVEMLIASADDFFPGAEEFGSHSRRSIEFGSISRKSNEYSRELELQVPPDVVPQTNGETDTVPPSPSPSSISLAYSDIVHYSSGPKPCSPKTARRPKKPAPPAPSTLHQPSQVTRDTAAGNNSHELYAERPRALAPSTKISVNAIGAFSNRPPPVPEKPRQEVLGSKEAHMAHRRAPSYQGPMFPEKPSTAALRSAPPVMTTQNPNPAEDLKLQPHLFGHRRQGSSPIQDFPHIEKTQVHMANIEKSQVTFVNVNVTPAIPAQDHSASTMPPSTDRTEVEEPCSGEADEKSVEVTTSDPEARVLVPPDRPPERPPRPNCEPHNSFLQRVRSFSQDVERPPRPCSMSQSGAQPQLMPPPPQSPWQTHSLDRTGRLSLPDSSEPPERPLKPDRLRQAATSPSGVEDSCKEKEKVKEMEKDREKDRSLATPQQPSGSSSAAQRRVNSPDDAHANLGDAVAETSGAFRSSPVVPRRPPRPHPQSQPPQPPVPKPRSLHGSSEDTYL